MSSDRTIAIRPTPLAAVDRLLYAAGQLDRMVDYTKIDADGRAPHVLEVRVMQGGFAGALERVRAALAPLLPDGAGAPPPAPVDLTLRLSASTLDQLDALVRKTGAASRGEVIQRALAELAAATDGEAAPTPPA